MKQLTTSHFSYTSGSGYIYCNTVQKKNLLAEKKRLVYFIFAKIQERSVFGRKWSYPVTPIMVFLLLSNQSEQKRQTPSPRQARGERDHCMLSRVHSYCNINVYCNSTAKRHPPHGGEGATSSCNKKRIKMITSVMGQINDTH